MEEGVINKLVKGKLGDLFDKKQFVHDVSGSGNNWAHGYEEYGK
jgi:tubulin epsilon